MSKKGDGKRTLKQALPWILVIAGVIGLMASTILTYEKIQLAQDPSHTPSCDISPFVSCSGVVNTPQAAAFGIPNSFIGIAGFAVVVTIGMAVFAGASFARWFWRGLQGGVIFGVGMVTWLQTQSIFAIGVLCPYCMVVWTIMIPLFWYVTLYNLREKHISLPKGWEGLERFLQKNHGNILVAWYAVILLAILVKFQDYWFSLV